jgi:hypothetical protein
MKARLIETSSLITKLEDTQDVQIVYDHQPLLQELFRTDQIHKLDLWFPCCIFICFAC